MESRSANNVTTWTASHRSGSVILRTACVQY